MVQSMICLWASNGLSTVPINVMYPLKLTDVVITCMQHVQFVTNEASFVT